MVPELEKPRVTELHVRMDCNGCVQKIRKAVHGIDGIYDMYIDLGQQKLTIVGRADLENILKAIKKTRKIVTVCSHTDPAAEQPPSAEAAPTEAPPASDAAVAADAPPAETAPPADLPKEELPKEESAPPSDIKPSPNAKDVEEIVHMVHSYPYDYLHRDHSWSNYGHPSYIGPSPLMSHENPNYYNHHVTQSYYNMHRPSRHITGYANVQTPPRDFRYASREVYGDDYYYANYHEHGGGSSSGEGSNGSINSMFSDENPNACCII